MHLGLICPDLTGHLNPMTTLGSALVRAGHQVTLFGQPGLDKRLRRQDLGFFAIGRPEHESGELDAAQARLGQLRGHKAVRFTGQLLATVAAIVLRDTPEAFAKVGIDGLIVDQVSPAGAAVSQALKLPFAIACNALALNLEASVPPAVTPWPHRRGFAARFRNSLGNWLLSRAADPIFRKVNAFRARHGLRRDRFGDREHGELVTVAQQPAFLDYPREELPDTFHYTGPWHQPDRDGELPFPWEKLDGRPILYASLGTLQNRLGHLFESIAAACFTLDVQLVMSLGRSEGVLDLPLPPGAIVVPYAPQLALLRKAAAIVTHAGLNTALESLACGLPMVAIPVTNDQPGVARRLEMLGTAIVIPPHAATTSRLREAISVILRDPSVFRDSSKQCQEQLKHSPTVDDAAFLVGHALSRGQRLTRAAAAAAREANCEQALKI